MLIILIACFDIKLIYVSKKAKRKEDQYVIAGIVGMLIYQQIQNIGMTFGASSLLQELHYHLLVMVVLV